MLLPIRRQKLKPCAKGAFRCHRLHAAPELPTPGLAQTDRSAMSLPVEVHPAAAPESALGRDTGPCLPESASSSLRTCRTILFCTRPEDRADHTRAGRCPLSDGPC